VDAGLSQDDAKTPNAARRDESIAGRAAERCAIGKVTALAPRAGSDERVNALLVDEIQEF
jgi:hypothetical protein